MCIPSGVFYRKPIRLKWASSSQFPILVNLKALSPLYAPPLHRFAVKFLIAACASIAEHFFVIGNPITKNDLPCHYSTEDRLLSILFIFAGSFQPGHGPGKRSFIQMVLLNAPLLAKPLLSSRLCLLSTHTVNICRILR